MLSLETQMAIMESYDSSVVGSQSATSPIGRVIPPNIFGNLELKLAKNSYDIAAAQQHRYRVRQHQLRLKRAIRHCGNCEVPFA